MPLAHYFPQITQSFLQEVYRYDFKDRKKERDGSRKRNEGGGILLSNHLPYLCHLSKCCLHFTQHDSVQYNVEIYSTIIQYKAEIYHLALY